MDAATIEAYVNRFYGYGTWDAPIWFVGTEEGGPENWVVGQFAGLGREFRQRSDPRQISRGERGGAENGTPRYSAAPRLRVNKNKQTDPLPIFWLKQAAGKP